MAEHPLRKRAMEQRRRGERPGRPTREEEVAAAIDPRRPKPKRQAKQREKALLDMQDF